MACSPCSGWRVDRRTGLATGTGCNTGASMVYLSRDNSLSKILNTEVKMKPNLLFRMADFVYDTCAEYNLRYCHLRGFFRHDNYLSCTLMDIIILSCFLIANFIVFLTIVLKTLVHVCFVVTLSACWVKRLVTSRGKGQNVSQPIMVRGIEKYYGYGD